ncbi:hypothetical protein BDQ17DRAFT_1438644 [Cyathus striatus]|nr:hypothetical protein BDQ17DRAFT_1438644 [Cyathus striatus]
MAISYMPQPDNVSEWSIDTVEEFLKANRIAYNIHPWHIAHVKEKQVDGKILLTLEVASLLEMGVAPGGAVGISFLVRDLKKEKGMWVCPPVKKKIRILPSDDDIRPRIKQRKIVTMSHSSLARPSIYEVVQQDPEQRILDDLPQEAGDIPSISLLYDGFGEFLDIVDGRIDEMCKFYSSDQDRRSVGLGLLSKILAARNDKNYIPILTAEHETGVVFTVYSIACITSEFRNRSTRNSLIPEVQLVSHFSHSLLRGLERFPEELKGKRRIPGLGIVVIGPEVKFYAILSLDAQFRIVSLTPGLSCSQSSSDGRERTALYRAFTAASVLQARIHAGIIQSNMFTMESRHYARFPAVSKLRRWHNSSPQDGDFLEFEIYRCLHLTHSRNLYYARTAEDERYIIVKFAPPELLAYEYLPGGWYGVAIEELGVVPISLHKHIADHFSNWERDLNKLVAEFHSKGFVHGDLRDANIISGEDGCVKLVDFDWAGRDGLVSYPIVRLNPELLDGRASRDRIIRKEDDMRILRATLAKVARMMYY